MIANQRNALVQLLALLVIGASVVETVRGQDWDLTVVLGAVVLLQGVVLAGVWARRRPVGLRADLASWIEEHAAATGEPAARVADRCVAAYRAGLAADDHLSEVRNPELRSAERSADLASLDRPYRS
jgi:hypothetical protein